MQIGKSSSQVSTVAVETGTGGPAVPEPDGQLRLVFASFLMLFTELTLIRWVGANNVFVSEATNLVLLASFLGIGIGFLNGRNGRDYLRWTPLTLFVLVGFVLLFPAILHNPGGPKPFVGALGLTALPEWLSLTLAFVLTVAVMTGFGQAVARVFVGFHPLSAYRLDILGSIGGIAVFSILSFADQPPATWGIVVGLGLAGLLWPDLRWWQVAAVAGVIALLCIESFTTGQIWSPYNKILLNPVNGDAPNVSVSANNIPYQTIHPLSHMSKFYFLAYGHVTKQSLSNVLIIGAGTGNDVSVALHEGAKHIDAVEIDPGLLGIGRQHNRNRPYQNPRVTAYVADGRQFLEDTSKHYSLIMFALPDSQASLAGQSGIRLESFLLTQQSIEAAKAHLAPGGTFSMYNWYTPFVLDRYANTLETVFHKAPCEQIAGSSISGRQEAVLTIGPGSTVANCSSYWHGEHITPATDDWPFPYLRSRSIPVGYAVLLACILLGSILLVRIGGVGAGVFGRMRSYVDLAFMGAAFLLLETKNIVGFAVLFGTTWFVNALVFAGVLVAVYLAVETARWVKLPPPIVLYPALIVSLAVAWVVPQADLLSLAAVPRFLAGCALAFAPVYLANLIFSQKFKDADSAAPAFAANLLGAIVGGILEWLSLVTGYRALLILVAVLYACAFLTGRRRAGQAGALASGG
ncbi:MAG TPA: spermidine synthase [Streptosporangiaceae bacterium]|nr:spermidine synthase [Streptosporangiaceae bacterium]